MSDPLKMPTLTPPASNNKPKSQPNSFIETMREQGKSATAGVANSFVDQLRGTQGMQNEPNPFPPFPGRSDASPNPNYPPFNFAEFLKLRENRIRQQERSLSQQQRHTETLIFHQKEEKAKQEIEMIKVEIKKIIQTSSEVTSELLQAEQTIMTNTVEAGTYQVNFFQRIMKLLVLARKQLSESKLWLELFNSRTKQKSFYWGQVSKSGTKYMLSQERYMATQAG